MFPTGFIFGLHNFTPVFIWYPLFCRLKVGCVERFTRVGKRGINTNSGLTQTLSIIIFVSLCQNWMNKQINKDWTENPAQYSLAQDTEAFFFFNEISPWQRRKNCYSSLKLDLFYSRLKSCCSMLFSRI